MIAMTAARRRRPEGAVEALLMDTPKNAYLRNGHNAQRGIRLPLYLPGNGGCSLPSPLMAGGWDGAGGRDPRLPRGLARAGRGLHALAAVISPR